MIAIPVVDSIEALNGGLFISPGFGTHPVRVLDSFEIIFVTQGTLEMFEDESVYRLERNNVLLLTPGARHGGHLPYAPDTRFYWIHFRLRNVSGYPIHVPKVAAVRNPEELTELFCQFISDQESGLLDEFTGAQLIALMLATLSLKDLGVRRRESRRAAERLADRVQSIIDLEYRKTLTTSTIAEALGYNADYLERIFRRRKRMSIVDAIHERRIEAARATLRNDGSKNINEVAYECGFSEPAYFHRIFKRLSGMTPRAFRNLYSRTHINTH